MTFVIVEDDFSPIYVGDTGRPLALVFAQKQPGGTWGPVALAGATITMKMQGTGGIIDGTIKTCDPTKWTIDDAINGLAHYQWQSGDVDTAGKWTLYITITIGGLPVHADIKQLTILAAP